ncbi:tetratricopeptide repeat protein [bacterium 210820-DFI.6.37]|nr:tetratricopeptide repeat protein [bacterium 210820-DFI.6.37]
MAEQKKKTLAQSMGITRTVVRDPSQSDIQLREDRIGRYFKKYLSKFVFDEFSPKFIAESKAGDLMKGVPIPLRKKDYKVFAGGEGLSMLTIAENMAWVMGCDPHFKHTKDYVAILSKLYNYKLYEGMMKEGRDAAERGAMDDACIHFRAALCMKPDYLHAMYSYARACRAMYQSSNNEEYVGRFKAEALDYFELTTETHPRFAQGYYYLGYAYLNMGLYVKADLTWREFLRFSRNGKDKKEIRTRIKQLEEPVQIEQGYNDVMAGRYEEGIARLEPFLSSRFNTWWPLHYYLGVAYEMTGRKSDAVSSFKRVLTMNASHLETMEELVAIYTQEGDRENRRKYEQKIQLIRKTMEEDQKAFKAEIEEEDKRLRETEPRDQKPEFIEEIKEDPEEKKEKKSRIRRLDRKE